MKVFIPLFAILILTACAEGQYPVSGEECGPNDAVLTLDAADCTVPTLG